MKRLFMNIYDLKLNSWHILTHYKYVFNEL